MNILSQVTKGMQVILTSVADIVARHTGFIQRLRKLSGSGFVQTVVFGWLSNPQATLEELSQTAATFKLGSATALSTGITITPQGLDKRFTPEAALCLQKVLETSVSTVIADEPVAIPILRRFSGVYIQDSSTITLPDTLAMIWAGCGGSTEKNTSSALKAQIQLDLNTGKLSGPYLQPGREHDQSSKQKEMSLPEGSLRITDLGYFSLSYFNSLSAQGVYWLSRVKSQCGVYDSNGKQWDLVHLLDEHCRDRMDIQVFLGVKERVECRLIAVRVSDEVARIRRCRIIKEAKKDGKKPSNRSLRLATFLVLCCSVPYELLSLDEAFVLMRARWQIELIFKLWKNHGHIDEWRSEKPWRILCEVYAKLIAMIIQHWILLTGCWQYPNRSLFKAAKTIRRHAINIATAFATGCEYTNDEASYGVHQRRSVLWSKDCMRHWRLSNVVYQLGVG